MKREPILIILIICHLHAANAQSSVLPITLWTSDKREKFVFYISGDGGMNKYSAAFCQAIAENGYTVAALDAKTYFWERKTPEQTAKEISAYLSPRLQSDPTMELLVVGYSFGANVAPFIINLLPGSLKDKLHTVILISPSLSTDFEIHLLEMLGVNNKRSLNVVPEINKMQNFKVVTIFGSKEGEFPLREVQLKSFHNEVLPGGHHFDGNPNNLATAVLRYLK
jgi:type IV secretory pathway VirJ component